VTALQLSEQEVKYADKCCHIRINTRGDRTKGAVLIAARYIGIATIIRIGSLAIATMGTESQLGKRR
jgi:hypothetical protein